MQTRFSLLSKARPPCALDPTHRVHCHGRYSRQGDCKKIPALVWILRFLCLICGRTISVLPDELLPYRPISAAKVQEHFDALAKDQPIPSATEIEQGCLKRAWERFTRRCAALAALLGQMMQLVSLEPKLIWLQLRRWGSLSDILLRLARPFNTSLLHDYLCLKPWVRVPD